MRVFRDYDATMSEKSVDITSVDEKVLEIVTPVKRKTVATEESVSTMEFPLTPPATIKSEKIEYDLKIGSHEITTKVTEHFVRRSKRRRTGASKDNPFD